MTTFHRWTNSVASQFLLQVPKSSWLKLWFRFKFQTCYWLYLESYVLVSACILWKLGDDKWRWFQFWRLVYAQIWCVAGVWTQRTSCCNYGVKSLSEYHSLSSRRCWADNREAAGITWMILWRSQLPVLDRGLMGQIPNGEHKRLMHNSISRLNGKAWCNYSSEQSRSEVRVVNRWHIKYAKDSHWHTESHTTGWTKKTPAINSNTARVKVCCMLITGQ